MVCHARRGRSDGAGSSPGVPWVQECFALGVRASKGAVGLAYTAGIGRRAAAGGSVLASGGASGGSSSMRMMVAHTSGSFQ